MTGGKRERDEDDDDDERDVRVEGSLSMLVESVEA